MNKATTPARLSAAALVLSLALTACDGSGPTARGGDLDTTVTTLAVSASYGDAAGDDAQARVDGLQAAIDELRSGTASGWTGRQDDVTGYLGELSGGRWSSPDASASAASTIGAFLDAYGPLLFGVDSAQVRLEGEPTADGTTTTRASQQLGDVPVLDGALTITTTTDTAGTRVNAVRGRVFPGLDVDTTPRVTAAAAIGSVKRESSVGVQGAPRLVVLADDAGVLTWEVHAIGTASGLGGTQIAEALYYVDARTGEIAAVRQASAHSEVAYTGGLATGRTLTGDRLRPLRPALRVALGTLPKGAALADTVQVSGVNDVVGPISANATQTRRGVRLIDTSVPTYDPTTGEGGIETWSMAGLGESRVDLPGRPYVAQGDVIDDGDAIAAQNYARAVYDYYASLGRRSWDGRGGTLNSSVHYGPADYCNAFFGSGQMVYGDTCTVDGVPQSIGAFTVDTAGHEITHGVTGTSAGLLYVGQSGALNESFSDYFGNIIGNRYTGIESDAYSEQRCAGITGTTQVCNPNPDGTSSLRYLPNGSTFADYIRVVYPGPHTAILGLDNQDYGGVHNNSAVWNNTLWSIRKRLAQVDGVPAEQSTLVDQFDHVVFAALTTKLFPSAGFVDARRAIEETILEAQASPEVAQVATEVFDANQICDGCGISQGGPGQPVTTTSSSERSPIVSGDRVAWLTFDASTDDYAGELSGAEVGGSASPYAGAEDTVSAAFSGDVLLSMDRTGLISTSAPDGTSSRLVRVPPQAAAEAGLAGSETGAAFVDGDTLAYLTPDGAITRTPLAPIGDSSVTAVGVGGGTVAIGTDDSGVYLWTPGGGPLEEIGTMTTQVLGVAAQGERLVAVDRNGTVAAFNRSGFTVLSDSGLPYGVAMNDEYAVWSEALGPLPGKANESVGYPDADLYAYSFATGRIVDLMPVPGQQAAPSISGDRIVWQDAAFGGDDVFTATLPSGL